MIALKIFILFAVIQSSRQAVYSCNQTVSCGCSKNPATISRIVGGEAAGSATWGWAVSISIAGGSLCGGSILSDLWVITAAHCFNGNTASQVTVYAGSTAKFSGSQTRVASRLIVHSGFNAATFENDITLIRLSSPLNMSDPNVSPICLPSVSSATLAAGEWPPANTSVVAVGWGRLTTNGILPSSLQQVTVQTVDYRLSACSGLTTDWRVQLCAGFPGSGKDTCQGDSGGPLMMFNSNRQWVLIGLTSNGADCASVQYAGVYTRVAAFVTWIKLNTNDSLSTTSSPAITTGSTSTTRSLSTTVRTTFPPIVSYANVDAKFIFNSLVFTLFNFLIVSLMNLP